MKNEKKINQLYSKILQFCAKGVDNEYSGDIYKQIKMAVDTDNPVNLVTFTCSTISSEYLFTKNPWMYVDTNIEGNNLESDLSKLNSIIKELRKIYSKVNLKILIGNTDPYYIYLQQFKNFINKEKRSIWLKFIERWNVYKDNLEFWINNKYVNLKPEVISWYNLEKDIETQTNGSFEDEYQNVLDNYTQYFIQSDLNWELKALGEEFGEGKYFSELEKPNDDLLFDWVKRKFSEYTVQALWIYINIPSVILIQNEKPSVLRSKMYQPLVNKKENSRLPIIYFFGIDNSGYQ